MLPALFGQCYLSSSSSVIVPTRVAVHQPYMMPSISLSLFSIYLSAQTSQHYIIKTTVFKHFKVNSSLNSHHFQRFLICRVYESSWHLISTLEMNVFLVSDVYETTFLHCTQQQIKRPFYSRHDDVGWRCWAVCWAVISVEQQSVLQWSQRTPPPATTWLVSWDITHSYSLFIIAHTLTIEMSWNNSWNQRWQKSVMLKSFFVIFFLHSKKTYFWGPKWRMRWWQFSW